jgi:hypothetical protein
MMDAIKSKGHDALVINDVEDGMTEVIVWEANKIKSAATQTKDNGMIIPLSRRFDMSTDDFRY